MKTMLLASLLALSACHGSDDSNNTADSNAAGSAAPENSEQIKASDANIESLDQYENQSNAAADSAANQMGANATTGGNAGGQ